jgi:nucleoredoxin
MEVVFCSMDNSEAEYKVYCSDMPWWCLPFQSPIIQKLAGSYRAEGIPHLVVIDKDGSVLCEDGISEVTADPEGRAFPWRCPNKLMDILPDTYLSNDGSYLPTAELDNKYLMLYFSASWSPRKLVSSLVFLAQFGSRWSKRPGSKHQLHS